MVRSTQFTGIDFDELEEALHTAKGDSELFDTIVNAPFKYRVQTSLLSLGIIVLLLVNRKTQTIDRIALTDNELAEMAKRRSIKKFEEIKIPLGHSENIIAKTIETEEPQSSNDWKYLFMPELTEEAARFNQADSGISFSAVYPLLGARDGGALIFSYYQYGYTINQDQKDFMSRYAQLAARSL